MELLKLLLLFSTETHNLALPAGLLASLCYVESHYDVMAINPVDGPSASLGVCEVKLETAKMLGFNGNEGRLMFPNINIHFAAKYLKKQLVRYHGDTMKAVAAYNSGTYREASPGVPKNKEYVRKVFNVWLKKK